MRYHIELDGIVFTAAGRASDEIGLSRDYIGRLCKRGLVVGRRVGTNWYVDMESLRAHLRAQEHAREHRRESLARQRADEYRANVLSRGKQEDLPKEVPRQVALAPEVRERMLRAV